MVGAVLKGSGKHAAMPIHRINLPLTPTQSFCGEQGSSSSQGPVSDKAPASEACVARNPSSKQLFSTCLYNNTVADEGMPRRPALSSGVGSGSSSSNHSNYNGLSARSAAQSSTSLLSMLSNQTATTEYSPNLIDKECGDLLKIIDLDISDTGNSNDNDIDIGNDIGASDQSKSSSNGNDATVSGLPPSPGRRRTHRRLREKVSFDLAPASSETDTESDTDSEEHDASASTIHKVAPTMERENTSVDLCGCRNRNSVEASDAPLDYNNPARWDYKEKWIFVLIGLPACGKSTMINDFQDYVLSQASDRVRVKSYNAGDVRRKYEAQCHNKFDFSDLHNSRNLRNTYALEALDNLANDLVHDKIDIGIMDATNTTRDRRKSVFDYIRNVSKTSNVVINPLLFEIKCSNRALRRFNIEQKSKNKDYVHMNRDKAIGDFLERIRNYELSYEKVTVEEIKLLNVKYFGIDNVGDTIYYDCGLKHHNNSRHENLLFKSIALNLLYEFLIHYRTNYAAQYLTDVDEFYTGRHYRPIKTVFSRPVSLEEVKKVRKASIQETNPKTRQQQQNTQDTLALPKVLSSSRINV